MGSPLLRNFSYLGLSQAISKFFVRSRWGWLLLQEDMLDLCLSNYFYGWIWGLFGARMAFLGKSVCPYWPNHNLIEDKYDRINHWGFTRSHIISFRGTNNCSLFFGWHALLNGISDFGLLWSMWANRPSIFPLYRLQKSSEVEKNQIGSDNNPTAKRINGQSNKGSRQNKKSGKPGGVCGWMVFKAKEKSTNW